LRNFFGPFRRLVVRVRGLDSDIHNLDFRFQVSFPEFITSVFVFEGSLSFLDGTNLKFITSLSLSKLAIPEFVT
jgi:hypothetical protein